MPASLKKRPNLFFGLEKAKPGNPGHHLKNTAGYPEGGGGEGEGES